MNLLILNRTAFVMIARNKMRTALTMLGIAIGVGAVVTIVAIGDGAAAQVQTAIANLGVNLIWIEAGGVNVGGVRTGTYGTKTLMIGDMEAIRAQVPLVTNLTPQVDTGVQLVYGNQNWRSTVRGVAPEYLELRQWPIARGAAFTEQDVVTAAPVCVLGQTVANTLFGETDPIDEIIRVKSIPCRVIGVLGVKGSSPTGQDQDDTFLMPYTTVQKKIKGQYWLDDILCSAKSMSHIDAAEQQIAALLRDRHRIGPGKVDDFNLRHPVEIAETVLKSAQTMELLLAAIASVSLLVGGIGVMNIMLVSVTERTREIGLRMSVGAKGADVLRQFLWEAILLSVAGGIVGMALGIATSVELASLKGWPVSVSNQAVVLAFAFSMGVGVFFGYYPARKAARMEPIDALRFEA